MTQSGSAQKPKLRGAAAESPAAPATSETNRRTLKAKAQVRAKAKLLPKEDLVEFFVFGISLGSHKRRPVLILKNKGDTQTLPVWLNPIDATYALSDVSHQAYASHAVTLRMMDAFGVKLERCVFSEIRGHHQYVRLEFSGNDQMKDLNVRADEAMSFCLALGARFFAAADHVARCRDIDAEIMSVEAGLNARPEIGSKNHRYVM